MTNQSRILGYTFLALLAAVGILFGTACGGDDDDGGDDTSAGSGGSDTTQSGSGGSNTAESGSGGSNSTMDSGTVDGNAPVIPLVALGGECSIAMIGGGTTIKGVCKASESECEAGTFFLDLSAVAGGITLPETVPTNIENKQADCEEGLTCCINSGQCSTENASSGLFATFMDSMSCVPAGSCNDGFEITFGCTDNQVCCVQTSISLDAGIPVLESGVPSSDDASQSQ